MEKFLKHNYFLHQALEQARVYKGQTFPNPAVGAVIVRNGNIISRGNHEGPGKIHAEIAALRNIHPDHNDILYVTLEPCCHHGRTPPCTDAIIASGIKNVVYAYKDPNHSVNGKGHKILMNAHINTQHIPIEEINVFYESYAYWQKHKSPYIIAKIAISSDNKIAGVDGKRVQITGTQANKITHTLRKESDVILTTANTILADNPKLNARIGHNEYPKHVAIVDQHNILQDVSLQVHKFNQSVVCYTAQNTQKIPSEKLYYTTIRRGKLDFKLIMNSLAEKGYHQIFIECGSTYMQYLLTHNFINKLIVMRSKSVAIGTNGVEAPKIPSYVEREQHIDLDDDFIRIIYLK